MLCVVNINGSRCKHSKEHSKNIYHGIYAEVRIRYLYGPSNRGTWPSINLNNRGLHRIATAGDSKPTNDTAGAVHMSRTKTCTQKVASEGSSAFLKTPVGVSNKHPSGVKVGRRKKQGTESAYSEVPRDPSGACGGEYVFIVAFAGVFCITPLRFCWSYKNTFTRR